MNNVEQGATSAERHDLPDEYAKVLEQMAVLARDDLDRYIPIYELICDFCKRMIKKYGNEKARQFKLFHYLSGSSLRAEDQQSYELDTPENEFGNFITGELASKLENIDI